RSQVYDIVHHLRPRLEIPQQGEAAATKKRKKLLPCQFVFASASMPTGGPNSVAAMISQRFCSAEMVTTSFAHSIPPSIKVEWFKASPVWDQRCAELAEILKVRRALECPGNSELTGLFPSIPAGTNPRLRELLPQL
ncbi:hypothetical protein FOZ63_018161, partial [Perkinsus olseni]